MSVFNTMMVKVVSVYLRDCHGTILQDLTGKVCISCEKEDTGKFKRAIQAFQPFTGN